LRGYFLFPVLHLGSGIRHLRRWAAPQLSVQPIRVLPRRRSRAARISTAIPATAWIASRRPVVMMIMTKTTVINHQNQNANYVKKRRFES
jgi:hypothetical protein